MTNKSIMYKKQEEFLNSEEQKILFLGGRGGYKMYLRAVRLMHSMLEEFRKKENIKND